MHLRRFDTVRASSNGPRESKEGVSAAASGKKRAKTDTAAQMCMWQKKGGWPVACKVDIQKSLVRDEDVARERDEDVAREGCSLLERSAHCNA